MASQSSSSAMPCTTTPQTTSPNSLPPLTSTVKYLTPPLTSETPSLTTKSEWDVFLSFCGKDTRNSFTDYVYRDLKIASVNAYRDVPELERGENITQELKQAIEDSKMYIVVFSKNYAHSTWCLEELADIYKFHQQNKRLIIAVYYKIDPSVVRHQKRSFRKAFRKHEARCQPWFFQKYDKKCTDRSAAKMKKINGWRDVLYGVAGISGDTIPEQSYKSEADIVTGIINRIQIELNPKKLYVADHPVGLDSRVSHITTLLTIEGFTYIGIYGMGGVGKTTLAKAVYNENHHLFERSCFLTDIRVLSRKKKGELGLQRQLIHNILKSKTIEVENTDKAIYLINNNIPSRKVLIVVDDVDDIEQFKWLGQEFASGSKIIITTRNEDLLESIGVKERYKVDELSDADSGDLFSRHTKLGDIIKSDPFTGPALEILERVGGLPKALTTFGDMLMNEESDENWRWFVHVLDQHLDKIIDECLLISYNALKLKDTKLQNIFQEIACLHIGKERKEVIKALEDSSYLFAGSSIDVLRKRSLLTISNTYILGMHILHGRMGRRIHQNSLNK